MAASNFYFTDTKLPTQHNLSFFLTQAGWTNRATAAAHFGDFNLNFDSAVAQSLEYKHLLAALIAGSCPQIMPRTYCIDDCNWRAVLSAVAPRLRFPCIAKPSLLNNGQHIKIFTQFEALWRHFSSSKRMGGAHVLQEYLEPHLLRDCRKYSLRQFVVLTDYNGAYLYKEGYFNVATKAYRPDNFVDLAPHLTNEHLPGACANVVQIPTSTFAFFPELRTQIYSLLTRLMTAIFQQFSTRLNRQQGRIALLGVDFIVDKYGQVWLLEVNHGPCFPTTNTHPLYPYLYQDFWPKLIDYFINPIGNTDYAPLRENAFFEPLHH